MSTYFAFPLADSVQKSMDELLRNLASGVAAPQHELHTRVSIELNDEILRTAVEDLINRFQPEGESAGILDTLLKVLKGTAHMLIRQLLGKAANEDVSRMAQYLRNHRLELNGRALYGFVLPEELAERFRNVFAAITRGEGEQHNAELHAVMQQFSALAMQHFYDQFVAPMNLGFIKRKASDLGRATIGKGIDVAINKLFPQMKQKELLVFAQYFSTLLIDA